MNGPLLMPPTHDAGAPKRLTLLRCAMELVDCLADNPRASACERLELVTRLAIYACGRAKELAADAERERTHAA